MLGLHTEARPGPMQHLDLAAASLGLPGVDANGDVHDSGLIALHVQILLAAWARGTGACDPVDYGEPSDLNGTDSPHMRSAVASFQAWFNAHTEGPRKLPEDGTTDPATLDALQFVASQLLAAHAADVAAPSVPKAKAAARRSKLLDAGIALAVGLGIYYATKDGQ